jgi:glycosyltransferase involved in cell wall biosynthesis
VRIALVFRNVNFTGSLERCTALLAAELARLGAEVHCFCNPATSIDIPEVRFHPVRPVVTSSRRLGSAAERASFALNATRAIAASKEGFDIVNVCGPTAWNHDVVTVHGVTAAHQRRWPAEGGQDVRGAGFRALAAPITAPSFAVERAIERLQFRAGRFARAIAVTERVADDLVRVHHVPAERIDVVAPPADVTRFGSRNGSNVRAELGLARNAHLLLFVGNDFDRNGLADTVSALAGLDETMHLVVVGDSDSTRHRRRAELLGVGARVHFVGGADRPERYFHDADLLVLPTKNDPWCMALVEGMAAGLPIVTSAVAGAAGVVSRNGAGVVLSDPTPAVLRAEVRALLADPERRTQCAAAGRRAAAEYSVERQTQQMLAAYEHVLRERRGMRLVPRRPAAVHVTPKRIATLPPLGGMNPYQRLLYEHLGPLGFELVSGARLRLSWLWAAKPDVDVIHIHWPQALYTFARGPRFVRWACSWLKLAAFVVRLRTARRLGYRLAWTVHQVFPHDHAPSRRDRLAARVLAQQADVLIAHDDPTAELARRELGAAVDRIAVIPHGSYVGIYPPGRTRERMRRELDVPETAFVFLIFGELRAHKEVVRAVEAFTGARAGELALVIAGMPKDAETIAALEQHAADDSRIRLKLEFVYPEHVAELFTACDAVIAPRADGGTSGSLILGPSLGLPTIAADRPAYREVLGNTAGWLVRPEVGSLRAAIEEAARDPAGARAKGRAGLRSMSTRTWEEVARRTAALLEDAIGS